MTMAAARKGVLALALSSSLRARSSSTASATAFQRHSNDNFPRRALSLPLPTSSSSSPLLASNKSTFSTESAKSSDDPSLHDNDEDYEWLKQSRPMRIQARLLPHGEITTTATNKNSIQKSSSSSSSSSSVVTKIIHFQRHGQGTHNELYKQWTDRTGIPLDLSEMDPLKNPMVTDVILDAPLTQKGRDQCMKQKEYASKLEGVELVIVSPLVRALQTAHITFGDYLPNTTTTTTTEQRRNNVKWIAHEGIREELGTLKCNKRRPLSETASQFPTVDYARLPQVEEDVLWNAHAIRTSDENGGVPARESTEDMSRRAYDFLTEFVYRRSEREIAVVGHSAWLLAMTGAVLDWEDDDDDGSLMVKSMFGQAELRSLELVFSER